MEWSDVSALRGEFLGPVAVLDAVDSTNSELLRQVQQDRVRPGAVLVARHQTDGRGSRGRRWHAAPDRSVLVSVLLPATPSVPGSCTTLLGCVAVGDLLAGTRIEGGTFKWPNDVLVRGHKIAGVLAESRVQGGGPPSVVLGIGVNTVQDLAEFEDYPTPATSLRVLGATVDVPTATGTLIQALDRRLIELDREGPTPLIERWLGGLGLKDRPAVLETTDGPYVGTVRDFRPEGHFVVEDPATGRREPIAAGHVLAIHHGD